MIPPVADIHTHNPLANNAIINLNRLETPPRPEALYSVGWHPWWGTQEVDFEWVERMAREPQVVMIGECGIDRLRGGDIQAQIYLTRRHALLAEKVGKPLILHIVRAWAEILALHKELRPTVPWIIHGFRGKPALARQLTAAGIHLSTRPGTPLPPDLPPTLLHHESD